MTRILTCPAPGIGRAVVLLGILVTLFAGEASAQTVTAFKTGEQTTGMTKQCYYQALGNAYTRTVRSVELCPLSIRVQQTPKPDPKPTPSAPATVTAFKTGERTTGMTKQCFYNALGNSYTRTIGSVELCPLSIRVRR